MFLSVALLVLFAQVESKLKLQPGWIETGKLKSEHATQAAAADADYVYAVSSTTVAQYERASGKLLVVSQGKAEHLNSAFLKEGKVYCAHSNYPKKPDESDIRVFDPKTKELTVFKEFKDPPGSLTWCIHDGKHWWCCFAHYQQENAKTLLIQFTEEFKELRRWTFPKIVIEDWDNMSASGGIWEGQELLVIGHHFKAIYKLRVPAKGDVLEFVEALECPFPGQGIAFDPKTKGLVGIDRPTRHVLFAERKKQ